VQRLLLFGYHGKLLKLAGGIFHTHHHLADGRAEVLTALAALEGLQGDLLQELYRSATTEDALQLLRQEQPDLEQRLRQRITAAIEARAAASIRATTGLPLEPGVALFDRSRQLWAVGPRGHSWFAEAAL
jgi:cobalt-precorrin-5B (C1)-methyltransferase